MEATAETKQKYLRALFARDNLIWSRQQHEMKMKSARVEYVPKGPRNAKPYVEPRRYTYQGKKLTVKAWAKELGLDVSLMHGRIDKLNAGNPDWSRERVFSPDKRNKPHKHRRPDSDKRVRLRKAPLPRMSTQGKPGRIAGHLWAFQD